ncbi:preprotein translocase subunit SecD [Youxingia wuxianensis]|uniref:Protein translocase subunit SecD n=1 Tax=Youxingia wuxianensis TaxID=2763678 RepID=A0A926ELQ0_9FIRM|nr:SecD/SecF family protein translocase subunit [Youxingia wuxianensis]MBC8584675.1 SecD/SecF family protein translocase subunit [Youxingia wuxianensis]
MKKVGKPMFFIVAAIIIGLTALSFLGVSTTYGDVPTKYIKGVDDIRWGIDIRGGVDVTFSPPEGYDATDEEMAAAESIIKVRMVSQNITDSEIYTDYNKDRIIVRFPWKEDETDFDPEDAVKELGETALLTFKEGSNGPVVIEGKHVQEAYVALDPQTGNPVVALTLTSEGATLFSEATGRLKGQTISIWMDDTKISEPVVNDQITDGNATISSPNFTTEEAKDLADKINGGALPFKLQTENFSSISATLGLGSRDAMVTAGIIAFILVSIFIIIMYRLPGVIACIALMGQVAGSIACITGFFPNIPSFTLTLPGIAGIILSIGMGVDANVITSERIKEELKVGKTIDGAIDSGFSRTFAAIFDGNITMVLVAVVLMGAFGPPGSIFARLLAPIFRWFGSSATGAIYSFGYTLVVGVIFNFLMGVTASRLMLKSISKFKAFKNPWLYGGVKNND